MEGRKRAIILFSGGLDSLLAARLVQDQSVDLQALVFESPIADQQEAMSRAEAMNLAVEVVEFTKSLVGVVERCKALDDVSITLRLECHAEMLRCAAERLEEFGCSFVVTGEVLNQGTPTQTEEALKYAADHSGVPELILRPLSAKLLPPTKPENEGWVSRDDCLDFQGADSSRQLELARTFGLDIRPGHEKPASHLADPAFIERLADLRIHEGLQGRRAIDLLRFGSHFRLGPVTKLVLGRTEEESRHLENCSELYDLIISVEELEGPTGLLPIIATEDQVRLAAAICAHYSNVAPGGTVPVCIRSSRNRRQIEVKPAPQDDIDLISI